MRARRVAAVGVAVVVAGLGGLRIRYALAQRVPLPTEAERIAELATFWREARQSYVFFDRVPALDWDSAFTAFIPRVQEASTTLEHVRVLQRFAALLGEGHTGVFPDRRLRRVHAAAPGVELDVVEGRPVVVNRIRALELSVPRGSVVRSVDGVPTGRFLSERVFPYLGAATPHDRLQRAVRGRNGAGVGLLEGRTGQEVTVELEAPDGRVLTVRLERHPPGRELDWLSPPAWERAPFVLHALEDGIVHVELNTFNDAEVVRAFRGALPTLQGARGIVLDVRANRGGNSGHALAIAGHFTGEEVTGTRSRAREHVSAYDAWGRAGGEGSRHGGWAEGGAWRDLGPTTVRPVPPRLAAPVVVLSGPATYSAAEDFLAYMKAVPGSVQIGETSAGSTGQPLRFALGRTARGAVTAKRDELPDGTPVVGNGVAPDVRVAPTLEDVRRGRDPVLERAREQLRAGEPALR